MKVILLICYLLTGVILNAQNIYVRPTPGPNSEQTRIAYENDNYYNQQFNDALAQSNTSKMDYYWRLWERNSTAHTDSRFWMAKSKWLEILHKNYRGAAKCAKVAYERGCYDCWSEYERLKKMRKSKKK